MVKPQSRQIVRIEWEDSCSYHGWWKNGEVFDTSVVVSVGILIQRTKKWTMISTSFDAEFNRMIDPLVIPASAIRKFTVTGRL